MELITKLSFEISELIAKEIAYSNGKFIKNGL